MKTLWIRLLPGLMMGILCISSLSLSAEAHPAASTSPIPTKHVLLLSIDGLHALDLARYVRVFPNSTLASLSQRGITYTNASTSKPSDSFPGLLSEVTGGSPASTGVFYDNSYDRSLSPPGSKCATVGTEVLYDETIDKDPTALDGGGGINPNALPLDPAKGCTPVYPHNYLRVNTIFEVIKAAGLRTAWSDKTLAYEIVNGPSGQGVEDLYTPEIAANNTTSSVSLTEAYDAIKVKAIINEINGFDHTGTKKVGVPAIFGMNFQAVSVGQKLAGDGYTDSQGTPSAQLLSALNSVDAALHQMVSALEVQGLLPFTTIILTAKHGQTPIDPAQFKHVTSSVITNLVNSVQPKLAAQVTTDDVALIWLTDQSKTAAVVAKLAANEAQANIQEILSGDSLKLMFNDPLKDSRTPDIIVLPNYGVVYAGASATKIAEHGGFNDTDTNVALLVSNPQLSGSTLKSPVETTQIAPTILKLLGLNPSSLQAVRMEQTALLPGLNVDLPSTV
ncbi:MAG: alkaline phosphatase family protein [Ktedonobacteraceae bacterium]|nr:alkaline phosphatase family protein [Ktedonobacteraceae bacterium]